MSFSYSSTWQSELDQPEQDELTEWHNSTNVILDFFESFLQYGSTTDHVQLSSLRDMNNALLVSTHLTDNERLAKAEKYHYQAEFLANKLQILFHRQKGTEHSAFAARYAVLHEQGHGARTEAAEAAALKDRHFVTIDPQTLAISRRSPTW